jgi:tRNA(Met) cytidine acetyltransferase
VTARLGARARALAAATRHRRAVLLDGPAPWGRAQAEALLAGESIWVGDRGDAPGTAAHHPPDQSRALLGREADTLVLDFHAGVDADGFGAAAGIVRAGGLLVLLTPPLEAWPTTHDAFRDRLLIEGSSPEAVGGRFVARLARVLASDAAVVRVRPGDAPPTLPEAPAPGALGAPSPAAWGDCATADQAAAVDAVVRVGTGRARRPVVLTADRGRGKSTALGIAAARLQAARARRILVTGPGRGSVEPVLTHARRLAGADAVAWMPASEVAATRPEADLVLVDEAAALAVPVLNTLLDAYPRIAFATTEHGYEGTGRGFSVRFRARLEARTPDWRRVRLEAPVRWAAEDPVERMVFRALLLDAAPPDTPDAERVVAHTFDRDALARDESTLRALFGLLVVAHYRTTPADLHRLLDGPNLSVHALLGADRAPVAAALVAEEGGFEPALCADIYEGRRRPRGHMLPETLACHAGLEGAPALRGARIVRIAVHPDLRRQGLGVRLLAHVRAWALGRGIDYLGAGFGATEDLLAFWRGAGHGLVRLGISPGKSSGLRSAVVVRPESTRARALFEARRRAHLRELPALLSDPLRDLDPALALSALRDGAGAVAPELDAEQWRTVVACAFGPRIYETTIGPVTALVGAALTRPDLVEALTPEQRELLVRRVLQRQDWATVVAALGLQGRAPAARALKAALRPLVRAFASVATQREVLRFESKPRV